LRKIYPEEPILQLTGAQDYVATMGQGVRPDRSLERLGKSDMGIVFLRRLFLREIAALANNEPKKWKRLDHSIELHKPQTLRNA
jgi:5,5'-dehydrodivanillate O-demethylase